MTGELDTDEILCRTVCELANCIVVNVDYRLTPEHKVPAQLQDTEVIYNWAKNNAASFGGDPEKFFTAGGSAGGALALELASRVGKNPSTRGHIKGVAAVVPMVLHPSNVPDEYKSIYTAYEDNKDGAAIIDGISMSIYLEHSGAKLDDAEIFIGLDTDNHKHMPPTYIVACERDPLRDDALVLEKMLKKAGVATKMDFYRDLPHYFWIFPDLPEREQFIENLINGVKWLISQM
jgi:versiconal hemiacetal acetate esterase